MAGDQDFEKATEAGYVEKAVDSDGSVDYDARINAFTPAQQRKIMRRIDIRLVQIGRAHV